MSIEYIWSRWRRNGRWAEIEGAIVRPYGVHSVSNLLEIEVKTTDWYWEHHHQHRRQNWVANWANTIESPHTRKVFLCLWLQFIFFIFFTSFCCWAGEWVSVCIHSSPVPPYYFLYSLWLTASIVSSLLFRSLVFFALDWIFSLSEMCFLFGRNYRVVFPWKCLCIWVCVYNFSFLFDLWLNWMCMFVYLPSRPSFKCLSCSLYGITLYPQQQQNNK